MMTRQCVFCASTNTSESIDREEWDINYEGLPKMIASVPITACKDCGGVFTDERAEAIRDAIYSAVSECWSNTSAINQEEKHNEKNI